MSWKLIRRKIRMTMNLAMSALRVVDQYFDEELDRMCIEVEGGPFGTPRYLMFRNKCWENYTTVKYLSTHQIIKYKVKS